MKYSLKLVQNETDLIEVYKLRYRIYCKEKKWIKQYDSDRDNESDLFDNYSVHFGMYNPASILVGTIRLIINPISNLPIFPIIKDTPYSMSPEPAIEVSRLAVSPENRAIIVFAGLLRVVYDYSVKSNLDIWYFQIDSSLFNKLSIFHFPHRILNKSYFYMGSDVVAGSLSLQDWQTNLHLNNNSLFRWFHNDPYQLDSNDHFLSIIDSHKRQPQHEQLS
jgi:N-acyl-L-homoserine lactone synthetase